MRILFPNIITTEDAEELAKFSGGVTTDLPSTKKVVNKIFEITGLNFSTPELVFQLRVEKRPAGQEWHRDTGSHDHMKWCQFGGSVLLTNSFSGGILEYRDGTKLKHHLHLALHSSDEEHRVTPVESGVRKALLCFIGTK